MRGRPDLLGAALPWAESEAVGELAEPKAATASVLLPDPAPEVKRPARVQFGQNDAAVGAAERPQLRALLAKRPR